MLNTDTGLSRLLAALVTACSAVTAAAAQESVVTGRPRVADMACPALMAEMDELSAAAQRTSDRMQAAADAMTAAQEAYAKRREHDRKASSSLDIASAGGQIAGLLPGRGLVSGLIGAAAGQLAAAKAREASDAASRRDLGDAQRQGEELTAAAMGQYGSTLRMQEVMAALVARDCK